MEIKQNIKALCYKIYSLPFEEESHKNERHDDDDRADTVDDDVMEDTVDTVADDDWRDLLTVHPDWRERRKTGHVFHAGKLVE